MSRQVPTGNHMAFIGADSYDSFSPDLGSMMSCVPSAVTFRPMTRRRVSRSTQNTARVSSPAMSSRALGFAVAGAGLCGCGSAVGSGVHCLIFATSGVPSWPAISLRATGDVVFEQSKKEITPPRWVLDCEQPVLERLNVSLRDDGECSGHNRVVRSQTNAAKASFLSLRCFSTASGRTARRLYCALCSFAKTRRSLNRRQLSSTPSSNGQVAEPATHPSLTSTRREHHA